VASTTQIVGVSGTWCVAVAGIARICWGVVGTPALAVLQDGEGVILYAELVAESIGLEDAGIWKGSVWG
jgi:hypothetical protein